MTALSPTPEGLQTIQSLKEQIIKVAAETAGKRTAMYASSIVVWLEENEKIIRKRMAEQQKDKS